MSRIRLSIWPMFLVVSVWAVSLGQDRVSTLHPDLLLQARPAPSDAAPAESFAERQIAFPSRDTSVSATLCLPLQAGGKLPILILLPEPGPADLVSADAVPLPSLAHGLAQAGIATLRYEKRALSSSSAGHPLTIEDEILDDAEAAVQFASKLPESSPSQMFLVGHALGGALAPYIAEHSPQIRGLILLAPAVMPIEYTLARYKREQLSAGGKSETQIQEALEAQNRILGDIRSGKVPNDRMILGAPASYWRDWMNRDVPSELNKVSLPMLILQAGRDARSNQAEFDKLEGAIGDKPRRLAEVHWFLNLDIRFTPSNAALQNGDARNRMRSNSQNNPQDNRLQNGGNQTEASQNDANRLDALGEEQHIDNQVIESISSWLQEHNDAQK
jgi:alpha/beta superfamily hydrolase